MALYQFKEIKSLHLELTSKCNAGCPMCARNVQGGPVNPLLPLTELNLEQTKKIFSPAFIQQLRKIYLCGNYGDPVMASECVEILQYFREANPELNLGMHTNGGARASQFWQGLAKVLSYCRFGIDGLQDTNHLYRQNVKWDLLERNVRSFVDAGGHAEWDYLVFKHNEHQVEKARELAASWGVKSFHVKSTSRFFSSHRQNIREQVPVHNVKGEHTHSLERAGGDKYQNSFYSEQENIIAKYGSLKSYWDQAPISCKVSAEKSLYVTAQGWAFPCCWVGNEIYSQHIHSSQNQVLKMIETLPGQSDSLNALKTDLQSVVEGEFFQSALIKSWGQSSIENGKLKVCARTCGQDLRPFENQFL
jgi:MoaA/NifB/PqqE/SkfB family radical SAM enzyme